MQLSENEQKIEALGEKLQALQGRLIQHYFQQLTQLGVDTKNLDITSSNDLPRGLIHDYQEESQNLIPSDADWSDNNLVKQTLQAGERLIKRYDNLIKSW